MNRLIKKYLGLISILFIFTCGVSACSAEGSEGEGQLQNTSQRNQASISSENDDESHEPTGYTDGGIQQPMIYYDGRLYALESNLGHFGQQELEEKIKNLGLIRLGLTVDELNYQWPSKNLEASRINVDTLVYLDKGINILYALLENKALYQLRPYEGDLYQLDAK